MYYGIASYRATLPEQTSINEVIFVHVHPPVRQSARCTHEQRVNGSKYGNAFWQYDRETFVVSCCWFVLMCRKETTHSLKPYVLPVVVIILSLACSWWFVCACAPGDVSSTLFDGIQWRHNWKRTLMTLDVYWKFAISTTCHWTTHHNSQVTFYNYAWYLLSFIVSSTSL